MLETYQVVVTDPGQDSHHVATIDRCSGFLAVVGRLDIKRRMSCIGVFINRIIDRYFTGGDGACRTVIDDLDSQFLDRKVERLW